MLFTLCSVSGFHLHCELCLLTHVMVGVKTMQWMNIHMASKIQKLLNHLINLGWSARKAFVLPVLCCRPGVKCHSCHIG